LGYPWAVNITRKEVERSMDVLVDILLMGISREEIFFGIPTTKKPIKSKNQKKKK
jgi:hypothetical protein